MFESVKSKLAEKNGGQIPFEGEIETVKDKIAQISENKKMEGDLVFMTTYMASAMTADVSRPELFEYTAHRYEYISTRYIQKVVFYVKRWNYGYAEGLRMVADRVNNDMLRSMFNRYANSIESGVPDADFLEMELGTARNVYRNTFEQGFEMLKKWGDAYIALLFSSMLVAIIIMISVAIYAPSGIETALNTAYALVLLTSGFGVALMYRAVPVDEKTINRSMNHWCSREQAMIDRLQKPILAITTLGVLLLLLAGVNTGMVYLMIGLLLAPLGIIGYIDNHNVILRDEDFPAFIRGVGSIMEGKGTTMVEAIREVDRKSLVALEPLINSAYTKLNLGLDEALTWERFIGDCGTNLIAKYMNIFRDSVALGGAPGVIGKIVGSSMLSQVLLRRKRDMVATGFIVLLVPMHIAMVGIFLALYEILHTMSDAITEVMASLGDNQAALTSSDSIAGSMMGSMNMFVNFPEDKMIPFVMIILLLITLANIVAGKIVMGGDRYMVYFLSALLFTITGALILLVPPVIQMFFQIPQFGAV
ncbi:archaellar assembly protein FlaJ [Methanofollis formosanus]|uniref:Archaellar assembly protein FlaJ n=1 Tax=Methanofollis formosanus TaxID=299308 RepID=A0A8G1EHG5_9EURY|nr:archaellar assembly protein FlaJ [Methanofollis formosanus]QYZ80249.1 archaellar assembly protein FlaJ [Methanofollis formosanus]